MTNILKNKWIILVFILTVAGIVVFNDFLIRPTIWSDEGLVIQLGRNLAETGRLGIAVAPGQFSSNRYYYTSSSGWVLPVSLAAMFKLFGVSFFNARLLAAFYLFGFIVVIFLLACRLWGLRTAVLSSLLLVSFAPLYGNGKSVLSDLPGLFWLALGFYLYEIFREKSLRQAVFSGLGFGLFFSAKPAFLILGLPALGVIHLIKYLRKKEKFQWFLVFWLAIFFAVLPTIWFGIIHPLTLESFQKTLSHYANNYYSPCVSCDIKSNLILFFTHQTLWHLVLLMAIAAFCLFLLRGQGVLKDWRICWLLFFSIFDLFYFLKSPGTFRYFFPLQLLLLVVLPACIFGIFKKQAPLEFSAKFLMGSGKIIFGWVTQLLFY